MIDLTIPQRQSPLAMLFLALRTLRQLGITQIVFIGLFLFRINLSGPMMAIPFVAIAALALISALKWWRFTFQLVDGELVVSKGVLSLERLSIAVDRIQSIEIEQELLHRMTGLVKVSVDTAGSMGTEFEINAVSRTVAEELQNNAVLDAQSRSAVASVDDERNHAVVSPMHFGDTRAEGVLPAESAPRAENTGERVVFTHDTQRLLMSALTRWPLAGLVVLGPILAFGEEIRSRIGGYIPTVERNDVRWWWVPLAVGALAILGMILNVIRVVLEDWQLTLHASSHSIRRSSGLLSLTSKASSVARIQVVSTNQNPFQRIARIRNVELSTFGLGHLTFAGCDATEFETIRNLTHCVPTTDLPLDRTIHPLNVWLRVRNGSAVALVVAVGAYFVVGWWSGCALLIIPFTWFTARRHVKNFRWSIDAEFATLSDVFDRSTRHVLLHKANEVSVTQTIFERRRKLAHVQLSSAAGTISVGMIPIDEANAVRDAILYVAETDRRPWM